jgi:ABC-type transport system involved in cytochrome bd biosynthesis fused ATPase/permease subunit
MAIQRGQLVGIVGGMGSGKSTLISALSGEIKRTKGVFHMYDKMIHVPNNPWFKTGTIRDNILFGSKSGSGLTVNRSKLYEKVNFIEFH